MMECFRRFTRFWKTRLGLCVLGAGWVVASAQAQVGDSPFIVLQSTTSTQNSGLYDALLPVFSQESGVEVRVVAVGTGQAIKNAQNCDGDLLIVHARAAEQAFVEAGYGLARHDLMYNDFVLVGPNLDPDSPTPLSSALQQARSIDQALTALFEAKATFVSRGDDSGTHKKELSLWQQAGVAVDSRAAWYRETGSGMGTTLNIAVGMEAYTLSDRATWIAFNNPAEHQIVFEGDEALFNQYGLVTINPEHCPSVKAKEASLLSDWLLSQAGQAAIAAYQRQGQPLFFPNAAQNP